MPSSCPYFAYYMPRKPWQGGRRGWHVTRSFLSPLPFSTSDGSDGSKNLCPALILPTHTPSSSCKETSMMSLASEAINPLQVGPPVASRACPRTRTPRLRLRSATRSCPLAEDLSIRILTLKAKPILNSITRAPTSFLPTGAPHIVSTEHDRDSQRV